MIKLKSNSIFIVAFIAGISFSLQISAQKKKISCVGNSITYGYGLSSPSTQSYPAQLQVLLGTTNWQVGNYGDSGRTMLKTGGYSYWNSWYYGQALASNPNVVVLGLGTNDAKDWLWNSNSSKFKPDYTAMVESFENMASKPDVWTFLLIPGEKADWGIYDSYIKKVNQKIKEVALEMGLGIIDLNTTFSAWDPQWYQSDNIHPSIKGSALIAQNVKDMLIMAKPNISFANSKVIAPNGDAYQWYFNGIPVSAVNGGELKEMDVTESGKYKVSIKLNAESETRILSKELDVLVSSVHSIYSNKIKFYPNPAFDVIQVNAENVKENATYTITDLSGKLLLKDQIQHRDGEINIAKLSKGIYILSIGDEQVKLNKAK